jgi:hypothetical protein
MSTRRHVQVAADLELATKKDDARAGQIRGIGAQRLTGYISMAQVAPLAMRDAAHTILEVTPEEEALLEENSAYWTKGNTLMYLDKLKDGQADYADLSYMLPYEFMLAPARAALQVYGEKGEVGANEAEQIFLQRGKVLRSLQNHLLQKV